MFNRFAHILICLSGMLMFSCTGLLKFSKNANFTGHIYEQKYNHMPMVGKARSKGIPLSSILYIYEPTSLQQIAYGVGSEKLVTKIYTRLVDSVLSDQFGAFAMRLKPGQYSLFVKFEKGYYVPFYSGSNGVSMIEIKPKETTHLEITLEGMTSIQ